MTSNWFEYMNWFILIFRPWLQVRQEIDRRLREKDEEFDNTRRTHQRALESLEASLEAETKAKNEALKQKKKHDGDIHELEVALDSANRANADLQKNTKKLQQTVSELETRIEGELRQRSDAREALSNSERKYNQLNSELDQSRLALEQAEKARKLAENDAHTLTERISYLESANSNLNTLKRKLEGEITVLQANVDEAIHELRNSEERVKAALNDAAKLADELKVEQVI